MREEVPGLARCSCCYGGVFSTEEILPNLVREEVTGFVREEVLNFVGFGYFLLMRLNSLLILSDFGEGECPGAYEVLAVATCLCCNGVVFHTEEVVQNFGGGP